MQWFRYLVLSMSITACGGGYSKEDVPADPIAFVRQEAKRGIVDLNSFQDALSARIPGRDEPKRERPRTSLVVMTIPTGEVRVVEEAGLGALPLDWSDDGARLLVGRREHPNQPMQLFEWGRHAGSFERAPVGISLGGAGISKGLLRIAWAGPISTPGQPAGRGIRIYKANEGDQVFSPGIGGVDPDVSPDGESLIWAQPSRLADRDPVIMAAAVGDTEGRPLGRGGRPRFSRDGKWIVFVRRKGDSTDVWLMRANGLGKRPIAQSRFNEDYPAVSPNGDYVVFASARGEEEASQLFLTRVSDGEEVQLTQSNQNSRPVW